jgi:hypothetical protein
MAGIKREDGLKKATKEKLREAPVKWSDAKRCKPLWKTILYFSKQHITQLMQFEYTLSVETARKYWSV